MAGKVTFVGAKELQRALKDFDPELAKQLRVAYREAAEPVAQTAKGIAPHRSGVLAASVRPTATQRQGAVRAGGAKVPYAGPIHFGWRRRNIRPQPFLYDALDKRRPEVIRTFEASVDAAIRAAGLGS